MIITQLELLFYDTQNLGREPQCVRRKVSICAGWPHIEDAIFGFALKGQITASAPAFKPKAENSDCECIASSRDRHFLSLSPCHTTHNATNHETKPSESQLKQCKTPCPLCHRWDLRRGRSGFPPPSIGPEGRRKIY